MPYINQSQREKLDPIIDMLSESIVAEAVDGADETSCAGILNYVCTRLILSVFRTLFARMKYWHIALISGVLSNINSEIYRKIASEFEDEKCKLNGEVPEFEVFVAGV